MRHVPFPRRLLPAAILIGLFFASGPAHAQLLREELRGEERLCTYVGTVQTGDTTVPRTLLVELWRPCPATAPFIDPNAPVPANAQLVREETTGSDRICLYTQGGVEYRVQIALNRYCAMTPGLLERDRARVPGNAFPSDTGAGNRYDR